MSNPYLVPGPAPYVTQEKFRPGDQRSNRKQSDLLRKILSSIIALVIIFIIGIVVGYLIWLNV